MSKDTCCYLKNKETKKKNDQKKAQIKKIESFFFCGPFVNVDDVNHSEFAKF